MGFIVDTIITLCFEFHCTLLFSFIYKFTRPSGICQLQWKTKIDYGNVKLSMTLSSSGKKFDLPSPTLKPLYSFHLTTPGPRPI